MSAPSGVPALAPTARESVANLLDEGTFIEYGEIALAARRNSRPVEELVKRPGHHQAGGGGPG